MEGGDRACRLGGGGGRFLILWRWREGERGVIEVEEFGWKSFSLVVEGHIERTYCLVWFGLVWFVVVDGREIGMNHDSSCSMCFCCWLVFLLV